MEILKYLDYSQNSPSGLIWNSTLNPRVVQGKVAGSLKQTGYYRVGFKGKTYQCHRLVWELHFGPIPKGYVIDHIDRNKANNHVGNLRLQTPRDNQLNKQSSLKYSGVGTSGDKFKQEIRVNGVKTYLGSFNTPEEAHNQYINEKEKLNLVFNTVERNTNG